MIRDPRPTTLLTGATGFLGQFLLRDLLKKGRRVIALVRSEPADGLRRVADLLRPLGVNVDEAVRAGNLLVVSGGLPGRLPEPDWGQTDEIVHCAASLQLFQNGDLDPFQTNVDGTRALLDWADQNGVTRFHAVSSAYVCGMNTGLIYESFHEPEPSFQTDYERSKWLGERELARWAERPGRVLTVYRPSFVVGETNSGYTTQYFGFYQLARLVSMLKQCNGHSPNGDDTYVSVRIPLQPDRCHNLVPVDFASRLICEAVANPALHGRIYHICDPRPPNNDFWKRCFEECFHLHGGYFVDPRAGGGARSAEEAMLWDQLDVLVPRLHHTPQFDQRNTTEIMRSANLSYPAFNHDRVRRLLDYAVSTGWGKKQSTRNA